MMSVIHTCIICVQGNTLNSTLLGPGQTSSYIQNIPLSAMKYIGLYTMGIRDYIIPSSDNMLLRMFHCITIFI